MTNITLVNVWFRTLLILRQARRRLTAQGTLPPREVSRVTIRTLPTDIDLLRHMNNGRYLSLFDLGRWDLLVRTGLFDQLKERGWYAVVASETITFRKSLELWQRFDIESRFLGFDEKSLYLEHRAVVSGEIYTRAIIRSRILSRKGGTVSLDAVFAAMGMPDDVPPVDGWISDWAEGSLLPSTRNPAPSEWH